MQNLEKSDSLPGDSWPQEKMLKAKRYMAAAEPGNTE